MKKLNIKFIGLVVLIAFTVSSCEKWINPDLNTDPNNPADVTMDLLLAPAQADLAYQFGGDFCYASWMWNQHISGHSRQSLTITRYNYTEGDVNNVWRWGMYSDPLMNLHIVMRKAGELNSPHYAGVAKVLTAYALMNMTDVWNDIPYSEAFQGQDNLKPAFDTQEEIYGTIQTLLTGAVADLGSTENDIPLEGDMIYDGDVDMWIQAAYSLGARAALHLGSKITPAELSAAVQAALTNGFQSNDDDLEFTFGSTTLGSNPYYQFVEQRDDHAISTTVLDMLNATSDPRLPQYVAEDGNGAYTGCAPGAASAAASRVGPYFASRTSPVCFMSYVELKFIEAEVAFAGGQAGVAAAAYNEAVTQSLAKYGVSDAAWEALNANEDQTTITLDKILAAKYLALFLQFEPYNDFRRHDNPLGLSPAQNNTTNGVFPVRYPYPTSERIYNGDNVPSVDYVTDKVWWDN